jgi:hypothetical protein
VNRQLRKDGKLRRNDRFKENAVKVAALLRKSEGLQSPWSRFDDESLDLNAMFYGIQGAMSHVSELKA